MTLRVLDQYNYLMCVEIQNISAGQELFMNYVITYDFWKTTIIYTDVEAVVSGAIVKKTYHLWSRTRIVVVSASRTIVRTIMATSRTSTAFGIAAGAAAAGGDMVSMHSE